MSVFSLATQDTIVLVLVLMVSLTLVRILEFIVTKVIHKPRVLSDDEFEKIKVIENKIKAIFTKVEDKPTLSDDQNAMLRELYELHSRTDADGIPLHYFPRSFIEAQKEIVGVLQEICSHQEKTTYLLESLIKELDRIEKKLEDIRKE